MVANDEKQDFFAGTLFSAIDWNKTPFFPLCLTTID